MSGFKPEQVIRAEKALEREKAKAARRDMQRRVSMMLGRAVYNADTALADVARQCGVAESKGGKWVNPDLPETPKVADLALMPRAVALCAPAAIVKLKTRRQSDDKSCAVIECADT